MSWEVTLEDPMRYRLLSTGCGCCGKDFERYVTDGQAWGGWDGICNKGEHIAKDKMQEIIDDLISNLDDALKLRDLLKENVWNKQKHKE